MKFGFAAASLLALGVFAGPIWAQDSANPEQPSVEQPLESLTPAALPEDVLALVNDRRASQELSDDELKQRAKLARRLLKTPGLPEDIKGQLQALMDADRAELESRVATQKPAEEPSTAPVQEAAPAQPEKVQQAEPEPAPAAPATVEIPQDVAELLNDTRDLQELSDEQLSLRAKFARQQAKNEALPQDVREKLAILGKDARQALVAREKAASAPKKQETEAPPVAAAPVQEQAQQPEPAPSQQAPIVEQPADIKLAEPPAQAAAPSVVDKVDVKELDANAGDPEAEKKARAFLDDATPAESLNDEVLRARLDGMRDLMAENELSVKTERALRDKLRNERPILRDRMAKLKADEETKLAQAQAADELKKQQAAVEPGDQPIMKKPKRANINIIINAETPVREILRDRRGADELDESELRYRIRARRDFETSDQFRNYEPDQRQQWREATQNDREFLGRRLREERNIRRVELEKPNNIRRIVIEDDRSFNEEDIPEDIFAAEVDDADIERSLLAPPRQKFSRKIRVDEIAAQPKVRAALTRIEVDTIRFGFNEAFVREEEVDSLDQIAAVIERILKKYPREVFLIEGHTDAVGSDPYNDKLSKARAEAVKKALTTYYIIPGKNLQTVGLGERYLKIPTADAEQENRRVSISRATAVVGEAED
jgi:outer membrane protein OmpA-like peptidoglycan-associated protein